MDKEIKELLELFSKKVSVEMNNRLIKIMKSTGSLLKISLI